MYRPLWPSASGPATACVDPDSRLAKFGAALQPERVPMSFRPLRFSALMLALPLAVSAQAASAPPELLPVNVQVASAVLPLPEEFRATATVLGYRTDAKSLVSLRAGTGAYICLADDPKDGDRYHVACYQKDLEPFMLRGRELRAQGVANVDSARFAEMKAGKLAMPGHPAALYSLTGKRAQLDAATGALTGARPLYVVYIPNATSESTGLPSKPEGTGPWIMFPGTPKAHIMFTVSM